MRPYSRAPNIHTFHTHCVIHDAMRCKTNQKSQHILHAKGEMIRKHIRIGCRQTSQAIRA